MKHLLLFGFIATGLLCGNLNANQLKETNPIQDLLHRITQQQGDGIEFRKFKRKEKDGFRIESENRKIIITGNNIISQASGLDYYLKNYCHQSYNWNSLKVELSKKIAHGS